MIEINETLISNMIESNNKVAEALSGQGSNYLFYIIISMFSSMFIYLIVFSPNIMNYFSLHFTTKKLLNKMKEVTGKHVIVMSHMNSGLFGSMITMSDVVKIEKLIRKFKSKNIDFIVNTFGGDLLASMRLAKLIKANNMRVIIPKYAWSGGTLAALGSNNIIMSKDATLSPVDPQLGTILKVYSAKYWNEIIKTKGKKADDESVAMSKMSQEIMNEMKGYLRQLRPTGSKDFYTLFLTGGFTHANQIGLADARKVGIKITELKNDLPNQIIESLKSDGVFGV